MAEPEGLVELRRTRNQAVIILVSVVDRRIVPALHFVSRLACSDSRALHISVDAVQTRRLASDWMDLGLSWLPLSIEEATEQSLPASVRRVIEREVTATGRVTVVVPDLDFVRWWRPILYRATARRIAEQLQPLPGVTVALLPFYVQPRRSPPAH